MKLFPLLFLGFAGCSIHPVPEYASDHGSGFSSAVVSKDSVISNSVGAPDRQRFVQAILESSNLEADLPDKVKGTPYQMEYFSMSKVAHEIFFIVSRDSKNRDGWVALSKVYALGDGEYARAYEACESAARSEFPAIFFGACQDWDSLTYKATRANFENGSGQAAPPNDR